MVSHILDDVYLSYLNEVLEEEYEEIVHSESKLKIMESNLIMSVLNNLELSHKYLEKLTSMVETETQQLFRTPKEIEEVRTCISSLSKLGFRTLLLDTMTRISSVFDSEIDRILNSHFSPTSYQLSEEEFSANDEVDPFVSGFCAELSTVLRPFQEGFTDSNFEEFIHTMMKGIVLRLEKVILKKSFNQLGGLQLDRDLRKLISFFSERTQRPVRLEFSRLIQMTTLLSLETAIDVMDVLDESSGNVSWRLTLKEVRAVLDRRGFSAKEIIEYTKRMD